MNYPYYEDGKLDASIRIIKNMDGFKTYPWDKNDPTKILIATDDVGEYWLVQTRLIRVIIDDKAQR